MKKIILLLILMASSFQAFGSYLSYSAEDYSVTIEDSCYRKDDITNTYTFILDFNVFPDSDSGLLTLTIKRPDGSVMHFDDPCHILIDFSMKDAASRMFIGEKIISLPPQSITFSFASFFAPDWHYLKSCLEEKKGRADISLHIGDEVFDVNLSFNPDQLDDYFNRAIEDSRAQGLPFHF